MQIAIYTRLSEDRDGTQTATARQQAECERYAAGKGWTVSRVLEDVDLSAYNRRVKRPAFEQLLTLLREGELGGVVAWKMDRLARRSIDVERLLDAAETSGGVIASVVDGIDTSG